MGCDGGVLAMQRKFMRNIGHKMNEKPNEEMSKRERALIRSRCCALSNELLNDPVVACELGNLYNKDTIIMALIERTLNPAFQHVRGLKDLIDCKFTINPKYVEASASATEEVDASGEVIAKYICPVTRVEWTPRQPFVIIRTTGWVLSDRAIREVGIGNLQDEYGPFTMDDVVKLVPDEVEEASMREAMLARRASAKAKKDKKRKREGGDKASVDDSKGQTTSKPSRPSASSREAAAAKAPVYSDKVMSVVEQAKKAAADGSEVYKSLFGDGKKSDKPDANKLFITTAAPRYTVA